MTSVTFETNPLIKALFSSVENLSTEALNALRFRLLRNILPSLTGKGNITPGLVCDPSTTNDADAKFILQASSSNPTPRTTATTTTTPLESPASSAKSTPASNKLLQLAMPFAASTTKTVANETVSFVSFSRCHGTSRFLACASIFRSNNNKCKVPFAPTRDSDSWIKPFPSDFRLVLCDKQIFDGLYVNLRIFHSKRTCIDAGGVERIKVIFGSSDRIRKRGKQAYAASSLR